MRVLTGFPNFPEGRLYDGYQLTWKRDFTVSDIPVRRVALFPSHDRSAVGRMANYASFALSASVWGPPWFRDIECLWVSNSPPTVGLPTWIIKARYRPRVVMHIMDLWPDSLMATSFGRPFKRWAWLKSGLDKWLSMTYDVADSIACTSLKQIELLSDRGLPKDKLFHVPMWVDETVFHPTSRDDVLARELGLDGKRVLMYAGALGEPQGLDVLLEACARLRDLPSFHCVIAGTGVAESRLRAQAAEARLANVSFLGRWPIEDMTRLMSVGDIHLVSLRSDPLAAIALPSKLLSTLACGKPIIAAAQGEAADVVTESGAGWVCTPGDVDQLDQAIRDALAADPSQLELMGQRGRQVYAEEFAVQIGVSRVEQLLMGRAHEKASASSRAPQQG